MLYPPAAEPFSDPAAELEIGWLVDLITAIRSVRSEMNIPPATLFPLILVKASAEMQSRANRWSDSSSVWRGWARFVRRQSAAGVAAIAGARRGCGDPAQGVVDFGAEKARLDKELAKAEGDITRIDAKLGNADFVARAPEEVIDEQREKREEAVGRRDKIVEALERLKGAA